MKTIEERIEVLEEKVLLLEKNKVVANPYTVLEAKEEVKDE